jgi:arylformamidase
MAASDSVGEIFLGPPPHEKGPRVFLDYDQVELDAAYDQRVYAPLLGQILNRFASNSDLARARIGQPCSESYAPRCDRVLGPGVTPAINLSREAYRCVRAA